MPSDKQQFEKHQDKILASWDFAEFEQHTRTRAWWYWFLGLGLIMLFYAIFTSNFLFALIIGIVTAIIVYRNYNDPERIFIHVTQSGIIVGDEVYGWREFDSFWIAYEPPEVKKLFFVFSSRVRPHISIPLENEDPSRIRKIIGKYLYEDLSKESEPTIDLLGRVLKL